MKRRIIGTIIILLSGLLLSMPARCQTMDDSPYKFARTLSLIDAFYVDSVSLSSLTEKAIIEILRSLDPHSSYISAKDVKEMNEPLNGNFEGIGIQFNIKQAFTWIWIN